MLIAVAWCAARWKIVHCEWAAKGHYVELSFFADHFYGLQYTYKKIYFGNPNS
jgi:hypothetical protein